MVIAHLRISLDFCYIIDMHDMKRQTLIQLLNRYDAFDVEKAIKNDMLRFIEQNEDCFERSLEIGHITGSSWLLNKTGDKALLMHHKKLDKWLQLGGHADGDSDILAVSIIEAQEESGITSIEPVMSTLFDIDIHRIPAYGAIKEHFHYDVRFLLRVFQEMKISASMVNRMNLDGLVRIEWSQSVLSRRLYACLKSGGELRFNR